MSDDTDPMVLFRRDVACLDQEALQALVSVSTEMPDDERDRHLAHVDECDECRETIVALLAAGTQETVVSGDPGPVARPARTQLGRYELQRMLGAGAMGMVFAAHDPELDRTVAVKLLRRHSAGSVERLRREGRALAALSHPNVVAVHDVGDHEDSIFIAMEYIDGFSLRGWLAEKPRTYHERLAVALGVGRGLAAAHAASLVHRDIKPDNILVARDGRVRIGDFGLVGATPSAEDPAVSSEGLTQEGTVLGTPAYMAPEQFDGEPTDRSDQWSYCVTMFEAFFGQRPFPGDAAGTDIVPTRGHRALRKILVRGLSLDADKRWPSMTALCDAIERSERHKRQLLVAVPAVTAIAIAVAAYAVTRPAPFVCTTALPAQLLIDRAVLAVRAPGRFDDVDHWLALWNRERLGACRDSSARTARNACLDRSMRLFERLVPLSIHAPVSEGDIDQFPSVSCPHDAVAATPAQLAAIPMIANTLVTASDAFARQQYSRAAELASHAVHDAKASGFAPIIVEAQNLLAAYQASDSNYAGAEVTDRELVATAETIGDDWSKALGAVRMVSLLGLNKRVEEAQHYRDYANAAVAKLDTDLFDELRENANAELLFAAGDLDGSIAARRRALAAARLLHHGHGAAVAQDLGYVANLLDRTDRKAADAMRAESAAEYRALGLDPREMEMQRLITLLGQEHRAVADGDLDTAIRIDHEALAIEIPLLGADSANLADLYYNLSAWNGIEGNSEDALDAARHALAIWERIHHRDSLVADVYGEAAFHATALGRIDEGVSLARHGVEIATTLTGTSGSDTLASARASYGRALLAANDPRAAEQLTLAMAWLEAHGTPSARGFARFALAMARWSSGDHARLIEMAKVARSEIASARDALGTTDVAPYRRKLLSHRIELVDAWLATHH